MSADEIAGGDGVRNPAEATRPAKGGFDGIKSEPGEVAVLGGECAGEDAGVAGDGIAEDGVARCAEGEEVRHEGALFHLRPAEGAGADKEIKGLCLHGRRVGRV